MFTDYFKILELILNFVKKKIWFLTLVPIVILSQLILLEPHLGYGFSDVDWGFLSFYKESKAQYPNLLANFLATFQNWGVYTHQSYYIGIQSDFYALDFKSFQITTHVFKILATLAAYPLFLIITESTLASFIGTLLFAFAYPAVGTMYTTVTSSDYSAVLAMNIFLYVYCLMIKKNIKKWYLLGTLLLLFVLTLILSTERMYPIILWIVTSEAFLLYFLRSSSYLKVASRRIFVLLGPILIIAVLKPKVWMDFLSTNGLSLINSITEGDLPHLIKPFVSIGSLIIPVNHWRYLGVVKVENFTTYIDYFMRGPFVIFFITTSVLGFIIFKKSLRFIFQMLFGVSLIAVISYIFVTNQKTHFDVSFTAGGLIGGFLIVLGIVSFIHWYLYQREEKLLIGIYAGLTSAFLYIVLTWIGSDLYLTPTGVHRYLTVPALFISLSLSCVITLLVKRIWQFNKLTRPLSSIPLLILIPVVIMWSGQIKEFFDGQLKSGYGAADKNLMRGQLLSYLDNLSDTKPSLFYFDFSEDRELGYYYDNTILGGFGTWMLWNEKINFRRELTPDAIWSQFDQLASAKSTNNRVGFNYRGKFYTLQNFYAFKLKDKKVYDIKEEVLKRLEIY